MTTALPSPRALRRLLALAAFAAGGAAAQDAAQFPAAAVRFLDGELPRMENAVKERDRDYFEEAMGRTVAFSDDWGFKSHANPALAPYRGCTEAVSDFVIVGLCRLMPNGSECDAMLATRFDTNLRQCRQAAGR
ncbi:hypothetical protein [Variovorax sp. N23]|uniref:hypothetical protein n=1 Tax=Variovorax sp. N23 TaxID=2980555 RepID=UPI0021C89AD1|nr:hypothetical protein [Variovorax sp. N23]MCU4117976.1 hypothetical protein [Variovorax sp. N23]